MTKVFVMPVVLVRKKKELTGKRENLSSKSSVTSIEKIMVNTIVLFLDQEEKTVFLPLIYLKINIK